MSGRSRAAGASALAAGALCAALVATSQAGAAVRTGTPGADRLTGTPGADRLAGRAGRDRLDGGAGADVIDARDGAGGDRVECGPGRDRALVDAGDTVSGCESVLRGTSAGPAGALAGAGGAAEEPGPGSEYAVGFGIGTPNTGSVGDDTWDNYVRLFGKDQTYTCTPGTTAPGLPVCVENPAARLALESFNRRTRALLAGGGNAAAGGFGGLGECFGFVSTSILFRNGQPDTAWEEGRALERQDVVAAGGLSVFTPERVRAVTDPRLRRELQVQYRALRDTIRERQLLQTSWTYESWWEQWAREARNLDAPALYRVLSEATAGGKVAAVSWYWPAPAGGSQGHAVGVRALEGTPTAFRALTYDPNYPRSAGSVLVVQGGRWWVEQDPESLYPKAGSAVPLARPDGSPTIFVLGESQMMQRNPVAWWTGDLRTHPHPFLGAFASQAEAAQDRRADPGRVYVQVTSGRLLGVSDPGGRQALTPSGTPNGDPATLIPGVVVRVGAQSPPSVSVPRGGPFVLRLAPQGGNAVRATVWDRRGFSVVSAQSGPEELTEVRVTGTATGVVAVPPPGADAQVAVLRRQGRARMRAVETSVRGARGPIGAALTGDGAARLQGGQGDGPPSARLSVMGRDGYARSVRAGVGGLGDGERLDLAPRWGDLGSGVIAGRRVGAGGADAAGVQARALRLRAVTGVDVSASPRAVTWRVGLRRPSRVTATVTLRKQGCGCTELSRVVRGASGRVELPAGLAAGRWRVEVGIAAQAPDNPFLMQRRQVLRTLQIGGGR